MELHKFKLKYLVFIMLFTSVLFFNPSFDGQQAQQLTPQSQSFPSIPQLTIYHNFGFYVQQWLEWLVRSGPHEFQKYVGSFTEGMFHNVAASNSSPMGTLGDSSVGNYVDPSYVLQGNGTYEFTTSFGVYDIKSLRGYYVFGLKESANSPEIGWGGFWVLHNTSGNWQPAPFTVLSPIGSPQVSPLSDHWEMNWNVTVQNQQVATLNLIAQFSRTAYPKISVALNKTCATFQTVNGRQECVLTVWDSIGLKDMMWVWLTVPAAGYDQYNGNSISSSSMGDGQQVASDSQLTFSGVKSWFVDWHELGANTVKFLKASNYLSLNTPALATLFPVNMATIDPTFGITTAGTSAYPRAKAITANGSVQIDTAQYKFGGASGHFGTGNYLTVADSADWFFGTGTFTIDFFVRFNTLPTTGNTVSLYRQGAGATNRIYFRMGNTSGTYYFRFDIISASTILTDTGVVNSSPNLTTATWYHIALVRYNAASAHFYIFQNGTQLVDDSEVVTLSSPDVAATVDIGTDGTVDLDGWLDEYEILNGTARWSASFTAPTVPWTRTSTTVLLAHMDGTNASTTFLDDTITGQTIYTKATLSGSATVTSVSFCSLTTSGSVILGIWTDSSGPSVLLWNSTTAGTSVNASACSGSSNWTTINISSGSPTALNLGTATYWLGYQWTFVSNTYYAGPAYASGSANTGAYTWDVFGTLQSTVSSPTLSTENYSEYATFTADILRIQGNARGTWSSGTSFTVVMGSTPTNGNSIIVTVGLVATASLTTVSTITGTNLSCSSQVTKSNVLSDTEIWLCTVAASAGTTITVNLSAALGLSGVGIADACEYSGLTSTPLDKSATNSGTGTTTDTGTTATTTSASELWVGSTFAMTLSGGQASPTNSFTLLDGAETGSLASEGYLEKFVITTGTANSGTTITSVAWVGAIATFKIPTTITSITAIISQTASIPNTVYRQPAQYSRLDTISSSWTSAVSRLRSGLNSLTVSSSWTSTPTRLVSLVQRANVQTYQFINTVSRFLVEGRSSSQPFTQSLTLSRLQLNLYKTVNSVILFNTSDLRLVNLVQRANLQTFNFLQSTYRLLTEGRLNTSNSSFTNTVSRLRSGVRNGLTVSSTWATSIFRTVINPRTNSQTFIFNISMLRLVNLVRFSSQIINQVYSTSYLKNLTRLINQIILFTTNLSTLNTFIKVNAQSFNQITDINRLVNIVRNSNYNTTLTIVDIRNLLLSRLDSQLLNFSYSLGSFASRQRSNLQSFAGTNNLVGFVTSNRLLQQVTTWTVTLTKMLNFARINSQSFATTNNLVGFTNLQRLSQYTITWVLIILNYPVNLTRASGQIFTFQDFSYRLQSGSNSIFQMTTLTVSNFRVVNLFRSSSFSAFITIYLEQMTSSAVLGQLRTITLDVPLSNLADRTANIVKYAGIVYTITTVLVYGPVKFIRAINETFNFNVIIVEISTLFVNTSQAINQSSLTSAVLNLIRYSDSLISISTLVDMKYVTGTIFRTVAETLNFGSDVFRQVLLVQHITVYFTDIINFPIVLNAYFKGIHIPEMRQLIDPRQFPFIFTMILILIFVMAMVVMLNRRKQTWGFRV